MKSNAFHLDDKNGRGCWSGKNDTHGLKQNSEPNGPALRGER